MKKILKKELGNNLKCNPKYGSKNNYSGVRRNKKQNNFILKTHSEQDIQKMGTRFQRPQKNCGLQVSTKTTEAMLSPASGTTFSQPHATDGDYWGI